MTKKFFLTIVSLFFDYWLSKNVDDFFGDDNNFFGNTYEFLLTMTMTMIKTLFRQWQKKIIDNENKNFFDDAKNFFLTTYRMTNWPTNWLR